LRKKERKTRERRPDEETPNFLEDSPHVPGRSPTSRRRHPTTCREHPTSRRQDAKSRRERTTSSGEISAKSRAAFLAAAFVSALSNVPDLFYTVAACMMKVSTPLRGTVISPVLAERVFLAVSVLLSCTSMPPLIPPLPPSCWRL
jgi:hypothetical protein